jgi:hypothetical protein
VARVVATPPIKGLNGCRVGSVRQEGDDRSRLKTPLLAGKADLHTPNAVGAVGRRSQWMLRRQYREVHKDLYAGIYY